MKATQIVKQIIDKGGVIGKCATAYKDDEILAGLYIGEMQQQVQHSSIRNLWGDALVKQVETFKPNIYENQLSTL
jgi:hypothetical protein